MGVKLGNSFRKNKRSPGERQINTRKLTDILTLTEVFFDQKRKNICKCTVTLAPLDSFE